MTSIPRRLTWIVGLAAVCVFILVPRDVEQRVYDPVSGQMRETTVRRVPISLGLDLRGGIHLALEVDPSKGVVADCADAIRRAERIVRTRINEFGTLDPVVQIIGDCRLIVELPGVTDPARAKAIVQRTAFLEFRITDSDHAFRSALPAMDAALRRAGVEASAATPIDAMSALLGVDTAQSGGDSHGASRGAGALSELLLPGQIPGEFLVPAASVAAADRLLARPDIERLVPRGLELRWGAQLVSRGGESYRPLYALGTRPIITGEELQEAVASRDPMTNGAQVQFELTRVGGRRFAEATERNIGNHLAILLDGRVEGQPPVIRERIASRGRIELSGRSLEEANDLALVLRAGALPAPLHVVAEHTIGPALGHDSIRDGVRASALAIGFVILVIGVYYGVAGLLAVGALFLYVLYTLGGLAAFGFNLTLPGLAGFALSIGMAVDANVLIFERIREELDAGKPARNAVNEGFKHAMSAIVDSNVTTALTALILHQVGTGAVKGFAITLIVGIAASMISSIFVTRTFFLIWLERRPSMRRLRGLSVRIFANASYDFIRVRRWAYAMSGALILPGCLLLGARGATYGIEFTGGAMVHVRSAEPVGAATIRAALEGGGLAGAEIQSFGSDRDYVVRARLEGQDAGDAQSEAVAAAVRGALDARLGDVGYEVVQSEAASPKVGGELQQRAIVAILFSFVATLIYLAFRFEWRFGLAAVLATTHDILATVAFIAYLDLEVSLVVVAAVLTVLGYSLNDTIVIFDRVRENLAKHRRKDLPAILNLSINETLPRTVLTGGTTLATALVLSFFAGEVIRPFALVMSFGIAVGTFSSIFVAAPILLWIERRWGTLHPGGATTPRPVVSETTVVRPIV
jgi:protein-export membrane protein SecD/preprotein translocase SecF subunit